MTKIAVVMGLMLYALSLALHGQQWYLSLAAGVLVGAGITNAFVPFPSYKKLPHTSPYLTEVEKATYRVIDKGIGRLVVTEV